MNEPLVLDDLPELDDEDFVGIQDRFAKLVTTPFRLVGAVILVASIAAAIILTPWMLLVGGVALVILEASLRIRLMMLPHLGYLTREHDLSVRRGLLNRSVTTIPYHRIQSSVVNQGPLEQRAGLATLIVSPARDSVSIPGLSLEDANRLRSFVSEQASIQAENEHDGA